jgi:hypothetical protein
MVAAKLRMSVYLNGDKSISRFMKFFSKLNSITNSTGQ